MKFKLEEIAVIISAMNTKTDGTARTFQAIQLPDVADAMKKLKVLVDKEGKIPEGDHELEFGTDEKKLIMECMDDKEWSSGDAEHYLSVKEKLS